MNRQNLISIGLLVGLIAIIAGLWFAGGEALLLDVLKTYGPAAYFGLLTLNNVLILPIPNELFAVSAPVLYPGQEVNLLALTVGAVTLSAIIDYWGGYYLEPVVSKWLKSFKAYHKAYDMLQKYGLWVVAVTSITPVPYSLVCWLCGIARCSFVPYLLVAMVTRGVRLAIVFLIAWGVF